MNKILFVCLSSYQPEGSVFRQRYDRQELYAVALWNLINQTKGKADICVVENTTESVVSIENAHIKALIQSPDVTYKFLINNNVLGSKNKGAGEFQMCMAVLDRLGDKLQQYDWVVYYTSRHILYDLHQFIDLLTTSSDDIIVSNPSYILPNGSMMTSAPGNYNDMLFVMKPSFFKEYCLSMDPDKLVAKRMSSETHLYNFVEQSRADNAKVRDIEDLWLCRYDYVMKHMHLVSNKPESYGEFEKVRKVYKDFYSAFPARPRAQHENSPQTGPLAITLVEKGDSILWNKIRRFFKKNEKTSYLDIPAYAYSYDIEPVWAEIQAKQAELKTTNILLPSNDSTSIYEHRLNILL